MSAWPASALAALQSIMWLSAWCQSNSALPVLVLSRGSEREQCLVVWFCFVCLFLLFLELNRDFSCLKQNTAYDNSAQVRTLPDTVCDLAMKTLLLTRGTSCTKLGSLLALTCSPLAGRSHCVSDSCMRAESLHGFVSTTLCPAGWASPFTLNTPQWFYETNICFSAKIWFHQHGYINTSSSPEPSAWMFVSLPRPE